MSNSKLVSYKKITKNKTAPRNHKIDTITPHVVDGNLTIEALGTLFSGTRQVSANYGIGSDGRIGLYVDEKDRSWCTGDKANDHRAITIEVSNDGGKETGYHISDKALNSLIKLMADIAIRNGIKELKWKNDKKLIGNVDKQNITVHRWFANKACPGDYMMSKMPYIVKEANKIIAKNSKSGSNSKKELYRIRKTWKDSKSQIGAFEDLKNAKKFCDRHPGYSVFDSSGKNLYTVKVPVKKEFKVEVKISNLNIRKGPGTNYAKTGKFTGKGVFTIVETKGNWGRLKSGAGWISLDYCKKI